MASKANANAAPRKPMQIGNSNEEAEVSLKKVEKSSAKKGRTNVASTRISNADESPVAPSSSQEATQATNGDIKETENGEKLLVKIEVKKTSARKGRKNVASTKKPNADESPVASSSSQEATQATNGDNKGTENGEKSPAKMEVKKTSARKGRKNVASTKKPNADESPVASSSSQEATQATNGDNKGTENGEKSHAKEVEKTSAMKGRKNVASTKIYDADESPVAPSSSQEATQATNGDNKGTENGEKSPAKMEVKKTSAKKGRTNVASTRISNADESPVAPSSSQEATQATNGDIKGTENGEKLLVKIEVKKTSARKGRKNLVSKKTSNVDESRVAPSSSQEATQATNGDNKGTENGEKSHAKEVKKTSARKGRKNVASTKIYNADESPVASSSSRETTQGVATKGRKDASVDKKNDDKNAAKGQGRLVKTAKSEAALDQKELLSTKDGEKEKQPHGRKRVLGAEDNSTESVGAKDGRKEKEPRGGRKRALAAEGATQKDDGAKSKKKK